jgi:UDP-glucose 4-epimerase
MMGRLTLATAWHVCVGSRGNRRLPKCASVPPGNGSSRCCGQDGLEGSVAMLVTGAAGFIGSHVAEHLLRRGHEVVALDDLSGGFADNVPHGAVFVEGTVLDTSLLSRVFAEHKITHVFHLAACAAEGLSHFVRRFNYTNNVVGSMNVLDEAVKADVRCFVFTSSIAVYGASQTPMRESLTPEPEDPYGIAKYAVEMDLMSARRMFGIDSIVFRPHNVYGERQHIGDRYRNVIGIFMNQLMRGEPMSIFGDGSQTRAFSYIGDVAPLIAGSIDVPAAWNGVFNIGADEPTSVTDLALMVAKAMGAEPVIKYHEARKEVLHAVADHTRLEEVFGYRAQWTLERGLAQMANWARRVGPREPSRRAEVEIAKNLPPSWA